MIVSMKCLGLYPFLAYTTLLSWTADMILFPTPSMRDYRGTLPATHVNVNSFFFLYLNFFLIILIFLYVLIKF